MVHTAALLVVQSVELSTAWMGFLWLKIYIKNIFVVGLDFFLIYSIFMTSVQFSTEGNVFSDVKPDPELWLSVFLASVL